MAKNSEIKFCMHIYIFYICTQIFAGEGGGERGRKFYGGCLKRTKERKFLCPV
jgi:hypothetical protein